MTRAEHFNHEQQLANTLKGERVVRAKPIYESIPLHLISMEENSGTGYMVIDSLPFQFLVVRSHHKIVLVDGKMQTYPWHLVQVVRPDRLDTQRNLVPDEAYTFMLQALGVEVASDTSQQQGEVSNVLKETVMARKDDYFSFTGKYVMDPTFKPDIELAIAARILDWEENQARSQAGMVS